MTVPSDDVAQRWTEARERWQAKIAADLYITVGMSTCGLAAGAQDSLAAIEKELARRGLSAAISRVGCVGMCSYEPMVEIQAAAKPRVSYGGALAEAIPGIFASYLDGAPLRDAVVVGEVVPEAITADGRTLHTISFIDHKANERIPFQSGQLRVVLSNCGLIDPESVDDYLALDGYRALAKVISAMTPEQVIEEVIRSGLRGRGGGGFSTGTKWKLARQTPRWPKYVICNADEGDPGAFMDRSTLEGDPHSVIEGMIIAGYAIGAQAGYIYCRAEYPLAIRRLEIALEDARRLNLLGDHILGSEFSFDILIKEGAGAFVCGEETALMASIQGERGQPWPRPPYPAVSGLWGQPSNVNNVKSYAYVPRIIRLGADWFKSLGTEGSPGTAVFALSGMVNRTGLIEVPMGITLGQIISEIGGGIPKGRKFKAVQTGGPLGGCLPAAYLDTAVDFDSLRAAGAVMGSGGMIVADESTCMVEFAKYFMKFACDESCGKCPPCRIGTTRMLETLERITEGKGELADLDYLRELAEGMQKGSLCALGQLAPTPILSALRHFEDEFLTHIKEQRCPAGSCQSLVRARCVTDCPAGVDVPAYLSLIAQGRYPEALAIHRESNPFPLICGRVCPAFCERNCRRGDIDDPIAIRHAKRFMADHEFDVPWTPPKSKPPNNIRVAVVGAGPCGLTAALRLAEQGYAVTVFERMPLPGGMMTYGIPAFRLPREALFNEIANIWRAGVDFRPNMELGADFTIKSLQDEGYRAIILTVGAHRSRALDIKDEDREGIIQGLQLLRDIAVGQPPDLSGKRVVVVGGGDTALDAARSSVRLGASEVHVLVRTERDGMTAMIEEIEAAEEDGVKFYELVSRVSVLGDQTVTAVEALRQKLGEIDESGYRQPMPVPGTEFKIPCDVVIPAIGELATWVEDESLGVRQRGVFQVSKAAEIGMPGVFAAGDAVTGSSTVVRAVAQGNLVAQSVDTWITTGELGDVYVRPKRHDIVQLYDLADYAEARRPALLKLTPEQKRARGERFDERESLWDEHTIQEECKRCLRCDLEWLERIGEPLP
jgi:NADH-quinone oxidoreductase subunit F